MLRLTSILIGVRVEDMETTTTTPNTIQSLYEAWQHAVRRGMPNRFALQKAYLAAKRKEVAR